MYRSARHLADGPFLKGAHPMSHRRSHSTSRGTRSVLVITAALTTVLAGCASDAADSDDAFAADSSGGGTGSVVFAEQPWVDLQVENEIAVQLLEQLGYDASIKKNLSVENAASALGSGDLDA